MAVVALRQRARVQRASGCALDGAPQIHGAAGRGDSSQRDESHLIWLFPGNGSAGRARQRNDFETLEPNAAAPLLEILARKVERIAKLN